MFVRMLGLVAALLIASPAFAAKVALVVGNDAYRNIAPLQKAVADARAYAALLRDKGFAVEEGYDLDFHGFNAKLAGFVSKIEPGDDAVFVYSGHGWSDGAQNYLVGVDAPSTASEEELSAETTPLRNGVNGVLDRMERRKAHLMVAIVDACRDNPFAPPGGRGFSNSRGLVPVANAPAGTFVVFSASPGQSAMDRLGPDDPDPNSVFTRVFLPQLRADLSLQDAVKATQAKVVAVSSANGGDQKPAYSDEVIGPACLSGNCRAADAPAPPPAPAPAPEPCLILIDTEAPPERIAKSDIDAGLRACAERVAEHPDDSRFTSRLRAAQEQRVLKTALVSKSKEAAQAYLVLYPSGRYAPFVQARLDALAPPPPRPTPAPAPPPVPASAPQFFSYPTGLDAQGDNFLSLRADPHASGALMRKLGPDALFTELSRDNGWAQVRLQDGTIGYVFGRYVACCRPGPAAGSGLEAKTRALILRYWSVASDPAETGAGLGAYYADTVDFFGAPKSHDNVVRDKIGFYADWSVRNYALRSQNVSCAGPRCVSDGIIVWSLESARRGVISTGASTSTFTVDWAGGAGHIVAEVSKVLHREAHKK